MKDEIPNPVEAPLLSTCAYSKKKIKKREGKKFQLKFYQYAKYLMLFNVDALDVNKSSLHMHNKV